MKESVRKEINEQDDGTAARNGKDPAAEAGEWIKVTKRNRNSHKDANKMPPRGCTEMIDKCNNVQQGTKETVECREDEVTQIRSENFEGRKPNNVRHE